MIAAVLGLFLFACSTLAQDYFLTVVSQVCQIQPKLNQIHNKWGQIPDKEAYDVVLFGFTKLDKFLTIIQMSLLTD